MKIEFSDCVLNTDSRELTRDGALASIEPKTLELLIYLIDNVESTICSNRYVSGALKLALAGSFNT